MFRPMRYLFNSEGKIRFTPIYGLASQFYYQNPSPVYMAKTNYCEHAGKLDGNELKTDWINHLKYNKVLGKSDKVKSALFKTNIEHLLSSDCNSAMWGKIMSEGAEHYGNKWDSERFIFYLFQVCFQLNLSDKFAELFKYIIKKKYLTDKILLHVCSLMEMNNLVLESCEDIIFKVLDQLPPESEELIRSCSKILIRSEKYRAKILGKRKCILKKNEVSYSLSAMTLINQNRLMKAAQIMNSSEIIHQSVIPAFISKLLNNVISRKMQVNEIQALLDILANKNIRLEKELINDLRSIFSLMYKMDKHYSWTIKHFKTLSGSCNYCGGKLETCSVSAEEIQKLKTHVYNNIIVSHNVYMSTTEVELNSFIEFIKHCKYDIVIDGLNVLYYYKSPDKFMRLMNNILENKMTPLIIGKRHFKATEEFTLISKKYPFFLADDISKDDFFVLYAALQKGLGTYYMSGDHMGFANYGPNTEVSNIFLRWQVTHQCCFNKDGLLIFPSCCLPGFQKSESKISGEFRYHLISNFQRRQYCLCICRLKYSSVD